ncbi:MAG: substrate-binding domain-containing protein [Paracoccaceae bacterium]
MKATGKTMLGTALAMLLSGASSVALAQDDITIAGVLINTQDPFWTSIGCGADARAKELGATLELYSIPNMDAAQMTAAFDAAILSQPDGLFGTSTAPNQFVTQFGELMANGVPVVTGNGTDPAAQYRIVWSSGDTAPYIDELLPMIPDEEGTMLVLGGVQGLPRSKCATCRWSTRCSRHGRGSPSLSASTPSSTSTRQPPRSPRL